MDADVHSWEPHSRGEGATILNRSREVHPIIARTGTWVLVGGLDFPLSRITHTPSLLLASWDPPLDTPGEKIKAARPLGKKAENPVGDLLLGAFGSWGSQPPAWLCFLHPATMASWHSIPGRQKGPPPTWAPTQRFPRQLELSVCPQVPAMSPGCGQPAS